MKFFKKPLKGGENKCTTCGAPGWDCDCLVKKIDKIIFKERNA